MHIVVDRCLYRKRGWTLSRFQGQHRVCCSLRKFKIPLHGQNQSEIVQAHHIMNGCWIFGWGYPKKYPGRINLLGDWVIQFWSSPHKDVVGCNRLVKISYLASILEHTCRDIDQKCECRFHHEFRELGLKLGLLFDHPWELLGMHDIKPHDASIKNTWTDEVIRSDRAHPNMSIWSWY